MDSEAEIKSNCSTSSCGHSSHPHHQGCDSNEGCVGCDGFVVSRGNPAKVLDLVDKAFDEMPVSTENLSSAVVVMKSAQARDLTTPVR
jgi:hypothetical protein